MMKHKNNPRIANLDHNYKSHNFLFRLVSSQLFLAIIGLIFLVAIAFPLARTFSQKRLVEKEIDEVKKQINEYEGENQKLKELIIYLQSDQSLEEQARLNLNLKKPDEAVVVIEDKKNSAVESIKVTDEKTSNILKWWHYFFN